jgi:hypothetical protein
VKVRQKRVKMRKNVRESKEQVRESKEKVRESKGALTPCRRKREKKTGHMYSAKRGTLQYTRGYQFHFSERLEIRVLQAVLARRPVLLLQLEQALRGGG